MPCSALGVFSAEIRRALKPDGTYFMQEFNFSHDLQQNIDGSAWASARSATRPAPTTVRPRRSLLGGEGTGTCMGEAKARELASEAGFTHFRRLDFPQNPFNLFYEIRNWTGLDETVLRRNREEVHRWHARASPPP
ncbi:MAG: hypothetical protein U0232_05935 [Thermomicrobiales bacterium]